MYCTWNKQTLIMWGYVHRLWTGLKIEKDIFFIITTGNPLPSATLQKGFHYFCFFIWDTSVWLSWAWLDFMYTNELTPSHCVCIFLSQSILAAVCSDFLRFESHPNFHIQTPQRWWFLEQRVQRAGLLLNHWHCGVVFWASYHLSPNWHCTFCLPCSI